MHATQFQAQMYRVCSRPGQLGPQGWRGERRKPYSQGSLHLFPLLLALGAGACALVHGSAVVLDSQEHSTRHYRFPTETTTLNNRLCAAVFIKGGGAGAGPDDATPTNSGRRLASCSRAWGRGQRPSAQSRLPAKGLEARGLLTSAAAALCAVGLRAATGSGWCGSREVSRRVVARHLCRVVAAGRGRRAVEAGSQVGCRPGRDARPPPPFLHPLPSPTLTCS